MNMSDSLRVKNDLGGGKIIFCSSALGKYRKIKLNFNMMSFWSMLKLIHWTKSLS